MPCGRNSRCSPPDFRASTAGAVQAVDAGTLSYAPPTLGKLRSKHMTDKSSFTPEEWKLLLESVTMAGIAVSAADPSGLWGLLKESFAEGSALMQAKMDPASNPLIKAVVSDFETAEGRSAARDGLKEKLAGSKPAEIKAKCIETLRQARALVDAKAPGDAAAFKSWL